MITKFDNFHSPRVEDAKVVTLENDFKCVDMES